MHYSKVNGMSLAVVKQCYVAHFPNTKINPYYGIGETQEEALQSLADHVLKIREKIQEERKKNIGKEGYWNGIPIISVEEAFGKYPPEPDFKEEDLGADLQIFFA